MVSKPIFFLLDYGVCPTLRGQMLHLLERKYVHYIIVRMSRKYVTKGTVRRAEWTEESLAVAAHEIIRGETTKRDAEKRYT